MATATTTIPQEDVPIVSGILPDDEDSNALDIVKDQFAKVGLTAQYKRRCPDGSLIDASENELNVLKAQAHVANTAQALRHLDMDEKTNWALDLKDLANELYARKMFKEAMNKYALPLSHMHTTYTIRTIHTTHTDSHHSHP